MLANHLDVTEPVSPVLHNASILSLQNKSGRGIADIVLALYCRCDVTHMLLALHPANYHVSHQLSAGLRVRVDAIGTFDLDKSVAAIVEFRDVSAKVLD